MANIVDFQAVDNCFYLTNMLRKLKSYVKKYKHC